ncbi:MAG: lamin tail domain-containing protein [Saprospiraceae bacterium]|nr:lamin tail domain-containing protein [Saprospiraceae bacterium]
MKIKFTIKVGILAMLFFLAFGKMSAQSAVVINEVMASNVATIADQDGEFDDWVELYNNSNSTVDLSGWFLSDNPDNPDKWDFPANTSIPAGGYLIVWADEDSSQVGLHANFKLSAAGEQLLLINASGSTVQDIAFGAQQADKGYARSPNGTGSFVIKNPTFKANNDTGISAVGEAALAKMLTISPNPVSDGEATLRSEKQGLQTVEVFDQLGRLRLKTAFFNEAKMDVSELPAGLYVVKTEATRQMLLVR